MFCIFKWKNEVVCLDKVAEVQHIKELYKKFKNEKVDVRKVPSPKVPGKISFFQNNQSVVALTIPQFSKSLCMLYVAYIHHVILTNSYVLKALAMYTNACNSCITYKQLVYTRAHNMLSYFRELTKRNNIANMNNDTTSDVVQSDTDNTGQLESDVHNEHHNEIQNEVFDEDLLNTLALINTSLPPINTNPNPPVNAENVMFKLMNGEGGYIPEVCYNHINSDYNSQFFSHKYNVECFPILAFKKRNNSFTPLFASQIDLDKESIANNEQFNKEMLEIDKQYDTHGRCYLVKYHTSQNKDSQFTVIPAVLHKYMYKLPTYGINDVKVDDVVCFPDNNNAEFICTILRNMKNSDMHTYVNTLYNIRKTMIDKVDYGKYIKSVTEYMYKHYDSCYNEDGVDVFDMYKEYVDFNHKLFRNTLLHIVDMSKFVLFLKYLGYIVKDYKVLHIRVLEQPRDVNLGIVYSLADADAHRNKYRQKKLLQLRRVPNVYFRPVSPWNMSTVDFVS
jgi:hypothetical protein